MKQGHAMGYDPANHAILYTIAGAPTAALPADANDSVVSPLGDRLLAEHMTDGNTIDSLLAIDSNGSTSRLETISNPADCY